jgi:membrane-associated protein
LEYLNFLGTYFAAYPYILVLLAFFLILFLFPIPEELILFTGGLLSAGHGQLVWIPTLICCIFGMFFTDYWYFLLAKLFGQNFLKNKIVRKLFSAKKQEEALHLVFKYGVWAVFIVRFIPGGIRNPVFFICGLSKIKSKNFIIASLSGATIVAQFSFWLGYFLHDTISSPEILFDNIKQHFQLGLGLIALLFLLVMIIKKISGKLKE